MTTHPSNFRGLMDTRVALGNGGRVGEACAYCWPALVHAGMVDGSGLPCCPVCAEQRGLRLFDPHQAHLPKAA